MVVQYDKGLEARCGFGADHCCYLGDGGACPFIEQYTVPGRRWACGLLRELGSWGAVYADLRHKHLVQPFYDMWGKPRGVPRCHNWPPRGRLCTVCGEVG